MTNRSQKSATNCDLSFFIGHWSFAMEHCSPGSDSLGRTADDPCLPSGNLQRSIAEPGRWDPSPVYGRSGDRYPHEENCGPSNLRVNWRAGARRHSRSRSENQRVRRSRDPFSRNPACRGRETDKGREGGTIDSAPLRTGQAALLDHSGQSPKFLNSRRPELCFPMEHQPLGGFANGQSSGNDEDAR